MRESSQSTEDKLRWNEEKEVVHSSRPIKFLTWLIRILPFWVMGIVTILVSIFYWIFSPRARNEAVRFQRQMRDFTGSRKGVYFASFVQLLSFSLSLVEKISGWMGDADKGGLDYKGGAGLDLQERLERGEGAFLIGSHLGNMELMRCLAAYGRTGVDRNVPVTVIIDTNVTAQFNRTLEELNPLYNVNMISASEIGLGTVNLLQERISSGGLVVIAGDRTSASTPERNILCPFLGKNALFPFGAFYLAALLNVPTYFFFPLRRRPFMFSPAYTMYVEKSRVDFDCSRKERMERTEALCREFVRVLEEYSVRFPLQWYNFHNFWVEEA